MSQTIYKELLEMKKKKALSLQGVGCRLSPLSFSGELVLPEFGGSPPDWRWGRAEVSGISSRLSPEPVSKAPSPRLVGEPKQPHPVSLPVRPPPQALPCFPVPGFHKHTLKLGNRKQNKKGRQRKNQQQSRKMHKVQNAAHVKIKMTFGNK